ncbi:MAG: DUF5615 family PIN-like protein [Bacteroidia bacterium]|nr:DUF5615 family PIN-like protein [Bacteroidia bacterium]
MSLKFIIDTQLPPLLIEFFQWKGYNSIHTTFFQDGHLLKDKQIREIAINEDRIIVTKDEDFIDYYLLKRSPPKILLIETGNISNRDLFIILNKYFSEIIKSFENNNDLVIVQQNNLIIY